MSEEKFTKPSHYDDEWFDEFDDTFSYAFMYEDKCFNPLHPDGLIDFFRTWEAIKPAHYPDGLIDFFRTWGAIKPAH